MNELTLRSIVGALLVAVAIGLTWIGGYPFAIFVAAVATGVYWEWTQIVRKWNLLWRVFGFIYALIPAIALLFVRDVPANGFALVMWIYLVTWGTDIGGYVAGKNIGGPRLAPEISPNKTWAGLFGGIVFAAFLGALWSDYQDLDPLLFWFGAVMAVAAQVGDLFESWMKRRAGVKDSGNLLPGHGGLFDRVDGLMFVATLFALIVVAGWI